MPDGHSIPGHFIEWKPLGPSKPTIPSGAWTAARTDAAQTFTGAQTVGALTVTTINSVGVSADSLTLGFSWGDDEVLEVSVPDGGAQITVPATGTVATLAGSESLTNKTLTSPIIATGLTASGSAANTFAGSTGTFITSSGRNTLSGYTTFKITAAPSAAAGSTVSDAAQLAASNIVLISSGGATAGVKLQTGVAGDMVFVINTSATAAELYAASGGTVNGLSADASVVVPASKGVLCFCTAADTWTVFDMTALAAAS